MAVDLDEIRDAWEHANHPTGTLMDHVAVSQHIPDLITEVARLREDNQRLEDQTVRQARELTAIRDASRGLW